MSIFRSAQMAYYNLKIPRQHVYDTINILADQGVVQIVDSKPNQLHRPFLNMIKRCEQSLNKITLLSKRAKDCEYEIKPPENITEYLKELKRGMEIRGKSKISYIDEIESAVEALDDQVGDLFKKKLELNERIHDMEDMKSVLEKSREMFYSQDESVLQEINLTHFQLVTLAGTVWTRDLVRFNKMLFRATRANSLVYTYNIHNNEEKSIFFILVPSGDSTLSKVNKICQTFGARKYPLPRNKEDYETKLQEIDRLLVETKQLYNLTIKKYQESLKQAVEISQQELSFYGCSKIQQYRLFFEREKLTYNNMNMLEDYNHISVAHLWIVQDSLGQLLQLLPSYVSINEVSTEKKPPTHFPLNNFTIYFQEIVNTYGTPRYGEINPGLFAIPIFPFLFGVMFGDIGHGGLLLAFAIWMCHSEKGKKLLAPVYPIRYLLLLMGIFAFYSGWIYNDFFSIPLNVFGSCYNKVQGTEYARQQEGCVYPLGLDPKWYAASNQLNYFNSFKMKFAVIIGVFQMSIGIFLKFLNTVHFKSYLDMIFEWFPQQIFLLSTFGYMCVLIIVKWNIPWVVEYPSGDAPSIIGQMIALPLKLGSTEGKPLWDIESQENLQFFLLKVSLILVPIMLIPKPVILWLKSSLLIKDKHNTIQTYNINEENMEAEFRETLVADDFGHQVQKHLSDSHQQHDISEIFVHQIIETIQFVLGCISNTASYLRLWALSLAHSQLSKVFLEKTIGGGITSSNIIIILFGYWFFFYITFGVIMCMDSMECFLHALRLQWVEFQSKFYKADGWKFEPLSFAAHLEARRVIEQ